METIKINENISLHYIEMKKLKTTVVGMYIRRPLKKEEAAFNAVLPYVLKSGCQKYPGISDINIQLQSLYGASLNGGVLKNGDNQIIFFDAETISDKYAPNGEHLISDTIDMLMNVVFKPKVSQNSFDCDIVEREKKTVKNRIESLINDKRSYAQQRCIQEVCQNDIFSISKFGDIKDVEKITSKSLYDHYQNIITSSQIDIFVAGDTDCEALRNVIEQSVEGLSFSVPKIFETNKIEYKDKINNVTENMDVTQGKLSIGFVTGINAKDKEYPGLVVANSIYGAGTHSKLFNNVREKLSLAYYASSSVNKFKGIMTVNAGIEFDNFKKAYDESILQLEEISKGNITDDELEFSISTIVNNLDSYYDDQRYMQLYSLDCLYLGISPDLEDYKKRIKAVTKEDVINVVKKIKQDTVYFLAGKETL